MNDWLSEAAGPAILVTVAAVEGSAPRAPGARMTVGAAQLFDTIGGGHLEMRAIETARAMLQDGRRRHVERFALGPSLGQCCGGVVHLAFEWFEPAQAAMLRQLRQYDSCRVSALDGQAQSALYGPDASLLAGEATPAFASTRGTHIMQEPDGRRWLVDPVLAPRAHLLLFGAGHVGAAIVRALAELPCTVSWIDERDDMFPATLPANVAIEVSDTPEAAVAGAPPGSSFLVMTHSHALDQRLAEAIMQRADVGWFGLIGSRTKRMQFEARLRARGVACARIDTMVCPIGLPGISNKAPAVIAASVCAQLLAVWEEQQEQREHDDGANAASAAAPQLRLVGRRTS
ncbi:MAG: xanthine dehydrogenase accessory protein XdhC [Pseudomonadota bacterium]